MRLRDINKTIIILAIGLSSLVICAGYAVAEAPPMLDLPPEFDAPPALDIPEELLCGNGTVDAGEYCDDGNTDNGDACNATCAACGAGFTRNSTTKICEQNTPAIVCGNGKVESGEVCDDGNTNNGDACNATCKGCGTGYTLNGSQCKKNSGGGGSNSNSNGSGTNVPQSLKFTQAAVFPVGFNPTMTSTKITYQVTQNAFIELKITDEAGVAVVTLVNNEQVSANKPYSVSWDGTNKAAGAGTIVKAGKYFFKIYAKTSAQAVASDTKTGEINVIYASDNAGTGTGVDAALSYVEKKPSVSINNNTPKKTAGTGPETAVYVILPLLGYLVTSFRKRG